MLFINFSIPWGHPALPGGLSSCLHFFHDASNKLVIVELSGAEYAYVHNLQGDIVAILDNNGTAVVQYKYDAWGRPIGKIGSMASTLGTMQPFRYRGYVYDEETGLYYLRTRYYASIFCRFVNPDILVQSGLEPLRTNMVCYCSNNPVVCADSDGKFGLFAAIVTAGAVIGGILGGISAAATGGDLGDVVVGVLEGAANGAIGAFCGLAYTNPVTGVLVAFAGSFAVDVTVQAGTQLVETGNVDAREIDWERSVRTGVGTALGTAVPAFGLGPKAATDAFATALIWGEASTLITVADIIYVNTREVYSSEPMQEPAPVH